MTIPSSLTDIWSTFEQIRVTHPRLESAHSFFGELRRSKREKPTSPKGFATLFAATQSGKSTIVTDYIERFVVPDAIKGGFFSKNLDRTSIARSQRLVIHVTLSSKATPRSLAIDILTAFGDPYASRGTEASLMQRAYDYMKISGTELLFIDEIQHLSVKKNRSSDGRAGRSGVLETTSVTDALKVMLIRGLVPIVFVGIDEARHHLFNDPQLAARCLRELHLRPLDFRNPAERQIFIDFIGRVGANLKVAGMFGGWSLLLKDDIPGCLHAVAKGRLGMVTNLLRISCEVAFEEEAEEITRDHLAIATDSWAIPRGLIDHNPFDDGLRELELRSRSGACHA